MDVLLIIGIAIAVAMIAGLAVYTGFQAKSAVKSGMSAPVIAGVIMGTLVGGSSTVGTAQLAYNFGMSAWWFTLGGGIGCLILALVYAKPMRHKNTPTLVGMIRSEYGEKSGMAAAVLNSVGSFINIISQLIAASAVILVVWPRLGTVWTVIISAAFMALYVVFGGTRGAGIVGVLKLVFLYISMVTCAVVALNLSGGFASFVSMVSGFCEETGRNFFSLICQGAGKDLGSGLSLILGILTTQSYAQGIIRGKSDNSARLGGLISAVMIPPIGICGILVGLFMRSVTDPSVFVAKTALTQFVVTYLPSLPAGFVLGTLFIASVGTGAGLALGISTVIHNDIIKNITHRFDSKKAENILPKVLIVAVLAVACCMSTGSLGDTILNFAFMSMGLRGATVFAPLCFLLWYRKKIPNGFALASIIAGPAIVLAFELIGPLNVLLNGIDSLFPGIIVSLLIMAAGTFFSKPREPADEKEVLQE